MKGKNLYVGNLSYSVTKEQIQQLFSQYGTVIEIKLIGDKGFGFVEMDTQAEAEAVKKNLNGHDLEGRPIRIDEARPRTEHRRGGFRKY